MRGHALQGLCTRQCDVCGLLTREAASDWGLQCMRYEIRDISPPAGVRAAMELQAEAERRKRAQILESEGARQVCVGSRVCSGLQRLGWVGSGWVGREQRAVDSWQFHDAVPFFPFMRDLFCSCEP
jgi:SPFH domain / Band 7 family